MRIRISSLFILCLLLLNACFVVPNAIRQNQEYPNSSNLQSNIMVLDVVVPYWLAGIPSGNNNMIGIARTSNDFEEMLAAAREMAAVQYARNLSSYNIRKYVQVDRTYSETEYYDSRSYSFQVGDPSQLWNIYNQLHLMDYFTLHNTFFFALFEIDDSREIESVDIDLAKEIVNGLNLTLNNHPDWYLGDRVILSGDYVISTTKASSSCLIDAWTKATQQARLLQSAFYSTQVQSLTVSQFENQSESTTSAAAIETLYKLRDIEFSRSYINSSFNDNNIRYAVYVELRIQNYTQ